MAHNRRIEFLAYGGPEVLRLVETETPEPQADEVVIQHEAIGVNFIDTYHRTGLYPVPELPSGIGLEGAGTVVAVGGDVEHVAMGDRVAYCSGPLGAYADAHAVKAERVVQLPASIDALDAAAVLLKGLTVQYLIRQIHPVASGETVLFHAAAGGVGLIAMQWLRALGVTVIGTVGSAEKAELATRYGCTHALQYRDADWVAQVRELTGGKGVPVVFDSVGAATFAQSLDCLAPRGLMVSFGNASGAVPPFDISQLAAKGSLMLTRPTLFHFTATRAALDAAATDLFDRLAAGDIEVIRGESIPLAAAQRAHEVLEARQTTGSTVLVT